MAGCRRPSRVSAVRQSAGSPLGISRERACRVRTHFVDVLGADRIGPGHRRRARSPDRSCSGPRLSVCLSHRRRSRRVSPYEMRGGGGCLILAGAPVFPPCTGSAPAGTYRARAPRGLLHPRVVGTDSTSRPDGPRPGVPNLVSGVARSRRGRGGPDVPASGPPPHPTRFCARC